MLNKLVGLAATMIGVGVFVLGVFTGLLSSLLLPLVGVVLVSSGLVLAFGRGIRRVGYYWMSIGFIGTFLIPLVVVVTGRAEPLLYLYPITLWLGVPASILSLTTIIQTIQSRASQVMYQPVIVNGKERMRE